MRQYLSIAALTFALLLSGSIAFCSETRSFETEYTTVHYQSEKQLCDFLWRIGRVKFKQCRDVSIAKKRIDRILDQVQMLLDMYPENFHVDIILREELENGYIAYYSNKAKEVEVNYNLVTDGVLAHELSHAVMNAYFKTPLPRKIQEILSQYVDRHLWQQYK
jgi:hypothetical protein